MVARFLVPLAALSAVSAAAGRGPAPLMRKIRGSQGLLQRRWSYVRQTPIADFSDDPAAMGTFPDPEAAKTAGCHPRCFWHCTDPVCDKTCSPVCEAPMCETRCPGLDERLCGEKCGEPDCLVICPTDHKKCEKTECGIEKECKTTCQEPKCNVWCDPVPCHSLCADPHCEWTCKDPEACPEPQCQMQCEQPKGCLTGKVVNEIPPPVDQITVGQALAKLEGPAGLEDAKPKL